MKNTDPLSRSGVLALGELRLVRADSTLFSVSGAPVPGKTRIVVVVSKAVAKRAVDRNLLRRRAKHALDVMCGEGKFRGWHVMVRAKKPALSISYETLYADIRELFERVTARYNT